MAKPIADPIMLLMTERNIDLQRELLEARRTIEDQRKEIDILYRSLARPVTATFNAEQLQILAELLCVQITDFSAVKKAHVQ